MIWLATMLGLVAGFALGRARLHRIVDWAEDWTAPGWRHWRFWPAAPVGLAALAVVWIVHPRRTLANVRAYRAEQRPVPAPVYDPQWAAKREEPTP